MHLFFCQYAWEQAWVFCFVNMLGFDHDHLYCLWPKWSGKIMVYQYVRLQFGPFPLLAWLQGYDLRWLFSSVWVTFLAFLMGLVHKLRKASPVFVKWSVYLGQMAKWTLQKGGPANDSVILSLWEEYTRKATLANWQEVQMSLPYNCESVKKYFGGVHQNDWNIAKRVWAKWIQYNIRGVYLQMITNLYGGGRGVSQSPQQ